MQKDSLESMFFPNQQQLFNYALQLRFNRPIPFDPYTLYAFHQQYNSRFVEQPKPSYSYIGLIAMAILSSPDRQLVLSDIYQWILDQYPYFRTRGFGWRNSIRHNLSLNDCFVKSGRSTNGKGHFWRIHPANLADFMNGDFRRRRAQRRARKSMGLSTSGDEDDDDIEEILPNQQIESYVIDLLLIHITFSLLEILHYQTTVLLQIQQHANVVLMLIVF